MQRARFLLVVVAFMPRATAAGQGDPLGPEFRANSDKTPSIVDQGGVR